MESVPVHSVIVSSEPLKFDPALMPVLLEFHSGPFCNTEVVSNSLHYGAESLRTAIKTIIDETSSTSIPDRCLL